ncbi:MAG: DotA/TraY family protein [Acidiferrobacter thiooxydans]
MKTFRLWFLALTAVMWVGAPAFAGVAPAAPSMSTATSSSSFSYTLPALAPGSSSGSLFGFIFYPLAPQDLGYNLLQRIFGPEVTTIAHGGILSASASSSSSTAAPTSGAGNVLAAGFGVMNTGILLIVALMTLFGSLTSILHTANRGEWMGKSGSVFWAPIRVIIGAGSLMPVFGGYSLIQALVLWGTMAGMGIANKAADVMIQAFVSRPAVVAPSSPAGTNMAAALLASQSCAAYYNTHAGAQLNNYNPAKATPNQWYVDVLTTTASGGSTVATLATPQGGTIWSHTLKNSSTTDLTETQWVHIKDPQNYKAATVPASADICGGVGYRVPLNLPSHGFTSGLLGQVNNPASLREAQDLMFNADAQGLHAAAVDTAPLAALLGSGRAPIDAHTGGLVIPSPAYPTGTVPPQAVAGGAVVPQVTPPKPYTPTVAQIQGAETTFAQAAQAFDAPIDQASSGVLRMLVGPANMQSIVNIVQKEGWLTIGGLWLNLARIDQTDHNLASPHTSSSSPSLKTLAAASRGKQVILQAEAIGTQPSTALGRLIGASARSTQSQGFFQHLWGEAKGDASDVISRVLMLPVEAILSVFVGSSGGWGNAHQTVWSAASTLSSGNPLILFMEAGQLMLSIAGGLMVTWLVAKVLAGPLAKVAGAMAGGPLGAILRSVAGGIVSKIMKGFFALAFVMIASFLVGGFVLGVLLPALPLIAFLSAAMGWMLMIVEAMVAAPLWAAAHVSFEGEGWAPQRAQMGYQIVAGLVLRPLLITIGAFLAMALMEAAAWLIGISFLGYASAYINGTQSITQALEANGLVIILIAMLVYVCTHSVRVMTILPDRVLKWIGGGNDALGAASDMQGHVNKVMGVAVMAAKPGRQAGKRGGTGGAASGDASLIDNREASE